MKEKIRVFFTENTAMNIPFMYVILGVMCVCFAMQYLTMINLPVFEIILLVLGWTWAICAKDAQSDEIDSELRERNREAFVNIAVWITVVFMASVIDALLNLTEMRIVKVISLVSLAGFAALGAYIVFGKENAVKTGIVPFNIYTETGAEEVEPGAVVLGRVMDPETHKVSDEKAILHYVDRFVHMIVYGPTGSGKTSLVLSPMVYQDLQNPELGVVVLEPKGDFTDKTYAWAKKLGRKKVTYFKPSLPKCPYFNPLMCAEGNEADMIENLVAAFSAVDTTSSSYFRDNNEMLLRNSLWTVKRLYGNDATFNTVLELMDNLNGKGAEMMKNLHAMKFKDPLIMADNDKIYSYFTQDYFPGMKGGKNAGKTYSDSSAIRTQMKKLVSNPILARVLIPPKSSELKEGQYLDFDRVLRDGEVLCLCSDQGILREMGTYLGYFLILTLQSSVFKRPGTENTRRGCMLYIDEFQKYSNGSMADLLTQGRSYRVACIFATQNRALINSGGESGRQFLENVSTNCRNIVVFPGASSDDANYFSKEFGTHVVEKEKVSYSNRAYVPKFVGFDSARVTTSTDAKEEPVFPPSTIIYQPFHTMFVRLISKNSVDQAKCIYADFVDRKLTAGSEKYLEELNVPDENRKTAEESLAGIFSDSEDSSAAFEEGSSEDILGGLFDGEEDENGEDENTKDNYAATSPSSSAQTEDAKGEDEDDTHDSAVHEDIEIEEEIEDE